MKTCSNVSTCVNTLEPSECEVGSKEDLPTARQGMEYDLAWSCAKDFEGSVRKRCQQCNRQDLEMLKPPSKLVIACIGAPVLSFSVSTGQVGLLGLPGWRWRDDARCHQIVSRIVTAEMKIVRYVAVGMCVKLCISDKHPHDCGRSLFRWKWLQHLVPPSRMSTHGLRVDNNDTWTSLQMRMLAVVSNLPDSKF